MYQRISLCFAANETLTIIEAAGGAGSTLLREDTYLREGPGNQDNLVLRKKVGSATMNKDKIFKLAKGFRGRAKNCIRIARERVEKALQYSYRDRRNKKRDMRSLWIERINAGTRLHGVNYGNFMHGLLKENIQLNRKVLSELSMHEPYSFKALVDVSRTAFPGNKVPKNLSSSSLA
ncbi:hypothetical protein ZIOFF_038215 [Zingiber officinale]|uniref:Large ribosomal subunit protein bL20c n=1 Tax=Zingiber officinale TaxID=94328 RepID=A0A8J5GLS2_ZINOF|nr:hypothetical protein ZIOFF_038215 [Zingiber officinale]